MVFALCAANKGFWAEVLGVGDFYYELAVQVVEICLRTRASNGGLIYVREMRDRLQQIRTQQKLSEYVAAV
jgi:ESCRT-II complex subunit VPS22